MRADKITMVAVAAAETYEDARALAGLMIVQDLIEAGFFGDADDGEVTS